MIPLPNPDDNDKSKFDFCYDIALYWIIIWISV